MRLDHLLSKEQFEGETLRAHPKVDSTGRYLKESAKSTGCRSKNLLAVSFSGFALEKRFIRIHLYGGLAQLGERLPCKQEVSGSNPLISTIWVASSAG